MSTRFEHEWAPQVSVADSSVNAQHLQKLLQNRPRINGRDLLASSADIVSLPRPGYHHVRSLSAHYFVVPSFQDHRTFLRQIAYLILLGGSGTIAALHAASVPFIALATRQTKRDRFAGSVHHLGRAPTSLRSSASLLSSKSLSPTSSHPLRASLRRVFVPRINAVLVPGSGTAKTTPITIIGPQNKVCQATCNFRFYLFVAYIRI